MLAGAGLYADDAAGAAAATGDGDQILRFCPCVRVVDALRAGLSPDEACEKVLADIAGRVDGTMFEMAVVAVDRRGRVGAASSFGHWHDHVTGQTWPGPLLLV